MTDDGRWIPVEIAGRSFRRLDLEHPEVGDRVVEEIESGVDVYYDRRWGLTERFCRFLLERPDLVEGRAVLVAGAGIGMESVVVGGLASRLVVNDRAPVALELCLEQLHGNGIDDAEGVGGSFEEVDLEGIDRVVACFVVYDDETRSATQRLLDRTRERDIPVLLANEDLGGHFSTLLDGARRPVRDLDPAGKGRFVLVGPPSGADAPSGVRRSGTSS